MCSRASCLGDPYGLFYYNNLSHHLATGYKNTYVHSYIHVCLCMITFIGIICFWEQFQSINGNTGYGNVKIKANNIVAFNEHSGLYIGGLGLYESFLEHQCLLTP